MFLFKPPTLAEDLQAVLSMTRWIGARLLGFRYACKVNPLPLRDKVEKPGTEIATPSSPEMERIRPWVCHSG